MEKKKSKYVSSRSEIGHRNYHTKGEGVMKHSYGLDIIQVAFDFIFAS